MYMAEMNVAIYKGLLIMYAIHSYVRKMLGLTKPTGLEQALLCL